MGGGGRLFRGIGMGLCGKNRRQSTCHVLYRPSYIRRAFLHSGVKNATSGLVISQQMNERMRWGSGHVRTAGPPEKAVE